MSIRSKNIYDPNAKESYRLSRTKIEDFLKCPRCFYLDRRMGVAPPPSFPFNLNSAVDRLLKKEFDHYRKLKQVHPTVQQNGLKLIPLSHEKIDEWRESLHAGITYSFPNSNLLLCGGVDDIWIGESGEWFIVDYKATSKAGEVTLDSDWQISYKRQMEIYQWLFRMNGFNVSNTGYFVYCNGDASLDFFNSELKFKISIIPYAGDSGWVESAIHKIIECLKGNLPESDPNCKYCSYRIDAAHVEIG